MSAIGDILDEAIIDKVTKPNWSGLEYYHQYNPYPIINAVVLEDKKGFKKVYSGHEMQPFLKDHMYPIPHIKIPCCEPIKFVSEDAFVPQSITYTMLVFTYKGTQKVGNHVIAVYKEESY